MCNKITFIILTTNELSLSIFASGNEFFQQDNKDNDKMNRGEIERGKDKPESRKDRWLTNGGFYECEITCNVQLRSVHIE